MPPIARRTRRCRTEPITSFRRGPRRQFENQGLLDAELYFESTTLIASLEDRLDDLSATLNVATTWLTSLTLTVAC
jgi:hypothetical protein